MLVHNAPNLKNKDWQPESKVLMPKALLPTIGNEKRKDSISFYSSYNYAG